MIIPTFDRPERLRSCLASLALSDCNTFEVIVVDDGSRQPITPVVREARSNGLDIRYHRQKNMGCGPAKRTGARLARGDVVLFTDDDCRVAPDWVRIMTDEVQSSPDALCGGAVVNGLPDNVFSEVSQDIASFLLEHSAESPEGEVSYFTGNNIGCRKQVFEEVGGFNECFFGAADDRELGLRWRASGRPLQFVPEAVVAHYHPLTLERFWRQHVHYGRGARRLRTAQTNAEHHFAGPGFYLDLVTYPLRQKRPNAVKRTGLSLLSQVATAYGLMVGEDRTRN